jgi:hypothetical protein
MPDELEVVMFQFDFDGEVTTQEFASNPPKDAETKMSQWLNKEADDIASDVEREVSRVFFARSLSVLSPFKPR